MERASVVGDKARLLVRGMHGYRRSGGELAREVAGAVSAFLLIGPAKPADLLLDFVDVRIAQTRFTLQVCRPGSLALASLARLSRFLPLQRGAPRRCPITPSRSRAPNTTDRPSAPDGRRPSDPGDQSTC
jgi:hypothetical protein